MKWGNILGIAILVVGLGFPIFYFWIWGIRYYFRTGQKGMAIFTIAVTPLIGFFIGTGALIRYLNTPQVKPIVVKPPRVFEEREYADELSKELEERGCDLDANFEIPDFGKQPEIYARGRGRTWFIPHHAYYFIYYLETLRSDGAWLVAAHKHARQYVNALYKTPKAIRLLVPVINTIVITRQGMPRNHISYVLANTKPSAKERWTGGEINHIYFIDLRHPEVISLKQMPSAGYAPILRTYDLLQSVYNRLIEKELARRV